MLENAQATLLIVAAQFFQRDRHPVHRFVENLGDPAGREWAVADKKQRLDNISQSEIQRQIGICSSRVGSH